MPTPSAVGHPVPVRHYTWPLTGMPAPAPADQPALSIKIDNAPAARPQSGLNQADLVFDCLVEGGLSRFFAVFQSQQAASVGPIRSARPVDGALLRALNGGLFAYSGAAAGEIAPAKAYSTAYLLSNDYDPTPFHRSSSRRAPDNVYASTAGLRAEAARRGAHPGLPAALFQFGPSVPGSPVATGVTVHLGSQSTATWRRSGAGYLRSQNGVAQLLADGEQVSARNVLVLHVRVVHSGIRDAAGNEDPFVLAYGSGQFELFRDGVVEHGRWSRPAVTDSFHFLDAMGRSQTFAAGRTWIELVPTTGSVATP